MQEEFNRIPGQVSVLRRNALNNGWITGILEPLGMCTSAFSMEIVDADDCSAVLLQNLEFDQDTNWYYYTTQVASPNATMSEIASTTGIWCWSHH
jgi:hypothetical protein